MRAGVLAHIQQDICICDRIQWRKNRFCLIASHHACWIFCSLYRIGILNILSSLDSFRLLRGLRCLVFLILLAGSTHVPSHLPRLLRPLGCSLLLADSGWFSNLIQLGHGVPVATVVASHRPGMHIPLRHMRSVIRAMTANKVPQIMGISINFDFSKLISFHQYFRPPALPKPSLQLLCRPFRQCNLMRLLDPSRYNYLYAGSIRHAAKSWRTLNAVYGHIRPLLSGLTIPLMGSYSARQKICH